MKKIIFFDLDNTIFSSKQNKMPSQTKELLKKIACTKDMYLGLATGRGPSKVHMLEDIIDLFTYKVFINGALAYKKDKLIYSNPLNNDEILEVLNEAKKQSLSVGFVAENNEYINFVSEDVNYGMKGFNHAVPPINEQAYLEMPIYQLWVFSKEYSKIEKIAKDVDLLCYPWHSGGADFVDKKTNKAIAIKKLLEVEKDFELIAVGDGHNDIKMIELADIGIAMDNTGFNELKEKADHIAPHIDADQLYDFFKELKIID